ncbi:MAG: mechanosensitive ion channel family protein [candidate division KSB1 bacterium]|nr:mechanosensitive ion channel family protein [candidate division KSB1 bacterium]
MNFDVTPILSKIGNWFLTTGLKIFLILIGTLIVIKGVQVLSKRLSNLFSRQKADEEYKKRAETLGSVIRHLLTVSILVLATLTILGQLGIEIGPILAAAGIVGLAVGFGAQSLIKDVINGFFILLEDQIRVGDVVEIAGKGGLVEKVNLKMTVLRDLAGNVHFIPNGSIDVVTNMTKEYSRYVFDIGVAYREDVDEVIEVIKEVDEDLRNDPDFGPDILEPIEILGLDQFADSAIIIKARTMTKPIKQWRVAREFNRRLKKKFDERDIEIPFPHLTLYMGQDKQGQAPPMHLFLEGKNNFTSH